MRLHTFESYSGKLTSAMYVANPEADTLLRRAKYMMMGNLSESSEGFLIGEGLEEAVAFLEASGFTSPQDYTLIESLNEALNVKYEGHESTPNGTEIFITINGHKYGYTQKDGDLDIADIARKFEKMLQFSAGKALNWLKKHTTLSSGSKSTEKKDMENPEIKEGNTHGIDNYMFFGNLKTIKNCVDRMLALDPMMVDQIIKGGHDWANDHIATSKDDVEEVCNWLCNAMDKSK